MSTHKDKLYEELAFKTKVDVEGISIDPAILLPLNIGSEIQEQIHGCFYFDHKDNFSINFPQSFKSPAGFDYNFHWDPESKIAKSGTALYPFTRNYTFGLNVTF